MPDEDDTLPPELPPEPPVADEPPAEPPVQAAPPAKKTIILPTSAMATIKADELKKGERKAQLAADRQAQELGYRDHSHMITTLQAAKSRKEPAPVAAPLVEPAPAGEPPVQTSALQDSRLARENARLAEQAKKLNRLRAQAEREAKRLQKQLDSSAAENELRIAATRAGVQDVDYGVHLLRQKLAGMPVTELNSFDEHTFFATDLRRSHPYLYRVEERPANTGPAGDGTNGGARPPPATPGGAPPVEGATVDVRKMSQKDYEAHLRSRGLTMPTHGMPG